MTGDRVPAQPGQPTVDGIEVVTLSGEIDYSIRDHLRYALLPPDGARPPRTVVDLSGVTFIDSTGINALIAAHRAATSAHGWLRLANPQQAVLRQLQFLGVDAVIPCYPALRQALST
ncbi:STAS domain-containing protein [Streptomyces sp. YS415]|uniref:STAS domain-containing protein n=1 Tax=Streptomyces sp. YS415 TaxID=2944806 RepID=UPI002021FD92|nr:STAS domain-containing protein [Streptomyces sp. YS415]MCL7430388.1 STAS domain-containing protein [Streptomyces sp. YS415]